MELLKHLGAEWVVVTPFELAQVVVIFLTSIKAFVELVRRCCQSGFAESNNKTIHLIIGPRLTDTVYVLKKSVFVQIARAEDPWWSFNRDTGLLALLARKAE